MNKVVKNIGIYVVIFAIVLGFAWFYSGNQKQEVKSLEFSEFVNYMQRGQVVELTVIDTSLMGTLKNGDKISAYASDSFQLMMLTENYIFPQIEEGTLTVTSEKPSNASWIVSLLPTIVMILIFVLFWFVFMQQSQGGGKGVMSFGKSRAKLHKEEELHKVTFADVAGLDEEKEELEEVVDFLKYPKKYRNLGARIPKGILLVGPPGTGKTYISKAAAGEAGVPFFSISGSDFVEMFVGVGASRVRDLFEQAKKNSPCIVFIDEIDAVGRKRGAGLGGGHDEREQTLNQLLVEMDGFGENTGIIILAATNRPDILDPALLRPGRFDRQVVIGLPDIKGREAIFRVHSKNKPLDTSVDPKVLARRTPGFTPADIENMLNEAALLTARRNGKWIRMDEIEEAITKVIAGPEKKSRVISEDERKLTAYHEAGHALVARMLPNTDPVHQVTIVPRGMAGGFTMILPKEDKYYSTKTKMEEQIVHLLGGRVAEKLTLNDISTGASNDIERATGIARDMVTKYGMSEKLGPVNYSSADEVFLGKDFSTRKNYSEEMASEIDEEIRDIIETGFRKAEKLLSENLEMLHTIAKALLEVETLDAEQFEALASKKKTAEELIHEMKEFEKNIEEANAKEAAIHLAELAAEEAAEAASDEPDSEELEQSGDAYDEDSDLADDSDNDEDEDWDDEEETEEEAGVDDEYDEEEASDQGEDHRNDSKVELHKDK